MVFPFQFFISTQVRFWILNISGIRFGNSIWYFAKPYWILNFFQEWASLATPPPPILVTNLDDIIIVGCESVLSPVYDYHFFTDRKGMP